LKTSFKPSIAVSITDEEVSLLNEDVLALIEYVELRVDLCRDTTLEHLKEVLQRINSFGKKVILTVRDPSEGGGRSFSAEERLTLYGELSPYAHVLDTEVSSGLLGVLKERLSEKTILGSFHDFQSTPSYRVLEDIYHRAKDQGADIVKVATRVESLEDLKNLARLCIYYPEDVVVVGMGRFATLSRVFFPFIGCLFTYASVGEPKAPGQVHVTHLAALMDEVMR
jgi:3-dehydroquinate dehydratase-1